MVDTWVVVADGSGCRIFESDASLAALTTAKELKNKHHPGEYRSHPAEGHDSGHHATESRFAGDVADEITRAVQSNAVRDVLLVAPKRFMGDLLAALPKPAADRVSGRIAKDFTAIAAHELAPRLRDALADNHELR